MIYLINEEDTGNEPLYCKMQKLFLKTVIGQETQREVRITVDITSSLSKVSNQILRIQITDDDDPYFLYSLLVTEQDYQELKISQGLLVDFHNFPKQMIRLLEQSIGDGANIPKFLLVLEELKNVMGDVGKAQLKFVETNNFKHLCHLVLILELGNDSDIKNMMLKKIKSLKDKIYKDDKNIKQLETQLQAQSKLLEIKNKELNEIKHIWNEEKLAFQTESSKELSEETEKLRRSQIEWKTKIEKEISDMESKYKNTLKGKEEELSKLYVEKQILGEKNFHFESSSKEYLKRIEALEKELASAKWEVNMAKKQTVKLDSDYHEKEKALNSIQTKLAVAEQELKDKSILMSKQQELLSIGTEQKIKLEETLTEKEKYLQKKQTSLQSVTDELVKANEIITKLQKELGLVSSKLKVRTGIALEQEKVIESGKKKILQLEEQLIKKEKRVKVLEEFESKAQKTIEELNKINGSQEKVISDNERMINWLNKRVNEQYKEAGFNWSSPLNEHVSPTASTPFNELYSAGISRVTSESVHKHSSVELNPEEGKCSRVQGSTNKGQSSNSPEVQIDLSKNSQENKNTPPLNKKPQSKTSSRPYVGFKRASPLTQTTNVPSSYFLK